MIWVHIFDGTKNSLGVEIQRKVESLANSCPKVTTLMEVQSGIRPLMHAYDTGPEKYQEPLLTL